MPRQSLSGTKGEAPFIDFQRKAGVTDTYSASIPASAYVTMDGGAGLMQLNYTPPFDAWWELSGSVWTYKTDAAYHYAYHMIALTPNDVDGYTGAQGLISQHSQVQTYEHRNIMRTFKLAAGVAYTAAFQLYAQGGAFQYYRGPAHLWIEGKAWPRG